MINLADKKICTGCSACMDVCPKHAISMEYDKEGFRYPVINQDICVECHLCEKRCPVLSNEDISKPYIKTFAGYSNNKNILMNTTSGGFATHLSQLFIESGGIVAGVKYTDNFLKAVYSIAEDSLGVNSFRGSKYIQSEKNGIFKTVKEALINGRKVLFIGCPCDIAGLMSVLQNVDKRNLVTCELVCMGVTSPKIAEEYAHFISKKYKSSIVYINARSKKKGWFVPTLEIEFSSGKHITEPLYASYYGRGFQIYNRPSCFNCKYRSVNGLADIRVGDFWGIKKSDSYWNKNGVSCIFVRTEKGLRVLEKLRKNNFSLFETSYSSATENNMSSTRNKGMYYEDLRNHFAEVFLKRGLIAACQETADFGYRMKRIIPASMQPAVKHLYHFFKDK